VTGDVSSDGWRQHGLQKHVEQETRVGVVGIQTRNTVYTNIYTTILWIRRADTLDVHSMYT